MFERLAAWFILTSGWQRIALALIAGALSALAQPPFYFFFVLFFTLPVLVWLIDSSQSDHEYGFFSKFRKGFVPGWWFGFGYFVAGLWWIGAALLVEAESFAWALPLAVLALPAGLAIFYGTATSICALFWKDNWRKVLLLCSALAGAEYLRGTILTGFPWNALGYAAMPIPLAMQTSAYVGLYGVTLLALIAFCGPLIALAMPKNSMGKMQTGARVLIIISISLTTAHLGLGFWRMAKNMAKNPVNAENGPLVRIMQPAIPQKKKLAIEHQIETVNTYFDLSVSTSKLGKTGLGSVDYLVWPESVFPFLLTERPDILARIGAMLPDKTHLLTGATRASPDSTGDPYGHIYNSVYLINGAGEIIDAADKIHLVPFGEYLPFQTLAESFGLRQLTDFRGGFDAGAQRKLLGENKNFKITPLICYEIIFPGQIISDNNEDAEKPGWLLNVTNDAWFGNTPGPYQHFHQARIRAIEQGLPLIRAANNGISAFVDPYGRVLDQLDLDEIGVIDYNIPEPAPPTLYSRYTNRSFFIMLGFVFLAGLFMPQLQQRII